MRPRKADPHEEIKLYGSANYAVVISSSRHFSIGQGAREQFEVDLWNRWSGRDRNGGRPTPTHALEAGTYETHEEARGMAEGLVRQLTGHVKSVTIDDHTEDGGE